MRGSLFAALEVGHCYVVVCRFVLQSFFSSEMLLEVTMIGEVGRLLLLRSPSSALQQALVILSTTYPQ